MDAATIDQAQTQLNFSRGSKGGKIFPLSSSESDNQLLFSIKKWDVKKFSSWICSSMICHVRNSADFLKKIQQSVMHL